MDAENTLPEDGGCRPGRGQTDNEGRCHPRSSSSLYRVPDVENPVKKQMSMWPVAPALAIWLAQAAAPAVLGAEGSLLKTEPVKPPLIII